MLKDPKKRLKVIVANTKTSKEYGRMIDDLNKVLRELYSVREVGQKKIPKSIR